MERAKEEGAVSDATQEMSATNGADKSETTVSGVEVSKKTALKTKTAAVLQSTPNLTQLTEKILNMLQQRSSMVVEGVDPQLHWLPPYVPKSVWTAIGDVVAARERETGQLERVPGNLWMSLRLDGSNFSKVVKTLRKRGILKASGYSPLFASCMQQCLKGIMSKFNAIIGYTQSDEMMILVAPASIVRGEQQCHYRGGRVVKTATLAAGFITATFITQLAQLAADSTTQNEVVKDLASILPHFDCRVGTYETWDEARAILLWRAYDCSVNGISDAVHQAQGSGKKVKSLGSHEKLQWLLKTRRLPLPVHQAHGTVMARMQKQVDGYNPISKEVTHVQRRVIEPISAGILQLATKRVFDTVPDENVIAKLLEGLECQGLVKFITAAEK